MEPRERIDPRLVAKAHNKMAAEYDQLDDIFYPWLFAQIHECIGRGLGDTPRRTNRAVDAGCGTGFQSFLLAQAGYDTIGFDIAADLVEVARQKVPRFSVLPKKAPPLFNSPYAGRWITEHHERLASYIEHSRHGRPVGKTCFQVADLSVFDFAKVEPDVVVSCGSVLSFVDQYQEGLRYMAASLGPGGRLFLEVEQKRNADLVWPVFDRLAGGKLGFDQTWREIVRNLVSKPGESVRIDYPFELHDGDQVVLPIWLFSVRELSALFRSCGLRVRSRLGVHQVTNLIPSTVLHRCPPSHQARTIFEWLRPLDAMLGSVWPFWRLGCSVIYDLEKIPT